MTEARGSGEMVRVCCCVLGGRGRTDRAALTGQRLRKDLRKVKELVMRAENGLGVLEVR